MLCIAMEGGLTHVSEDNILDQVGVQVGLGYDLLQERVEDIIELSVLETALEALGHGRAQSKCDHDIIGILLGATTWIHISNRHNPTRHNSMELFAPKERILTASQQPKHRQ